VAAPALSALGAPGWAQAEAQTQIQAQIQGQVQATAAIVSDDRFRGRSISGGRPVVSLDLAYDSAGGAYFGLAGAVAATQHAGPEPLTLQEYAGYVMRLPAGPDLDLGATHANYTEYYGGGRAAQYNEVYAGLIARHFAGRLYYSPSYFGQGRSTLYGELETAARPARGWRLSAHAGLLQVLSGERPPEIRPTQLDWRLGLATAVRSVEVELSWSGAAPDRDYYEGAPRSRSRIALGLSHTF